MFFSEIRQYLGVAVIGLFCSGCVALLPDSRMSELVDVAPDSWAASKEGKNGVDDDWVSRFGDDQLSKLVREAVTRNSEMEVAAERVFQAQQAAYMAGSSRRLFLNGGLSGVRDKTQFVGFPFGGAQTSNRFGSGLNMSWELDLWGRVRAGESAAAADANAVELEFKAAQASLAGQVCKAYFVLAESLQQVKLAENALGLRKESLELIRDRFEQALSEEGGSASQLRLAQTDVASSMAQLAQRRGTLEVARRQLELLVGRYPSGSLSSSKVLQKLPSRPPIGLPSSLLQRRPDILAAERRYMSAGHSMREAKLAPFPTLKLTGSVGTATDALKSILDSSLGTWSLGAEVGQNILTGGIVMGELRTRSSKEKERLAELRGSVLKAFGEVEMALVQGRWLAQQVKQLAKAEEMANDAAGAAADDFESGTIDALSLLTTRSRSIDLSSQVLALQRLQLENRVDLHIALGGDFQTKGK